LLHGWEGSAEATYVLSLGSLLLSHGFDVVRLNLRDHGATHHLNREIFHSCRLPEVVGAVRALAQRFAASRLYLAGFSLGGNFMLRVAADARSPDSIAGAVAVSPVLEPEATLAALERGPAVYRRSFLRRWSRSLRRKQRAWPGVHDFNAMLQLRQLREMTAGLVAQCTEFPSLAAYLEGYAVTGDRLATLRVPSSLLLAEDDPIVPAVDLARLAASSQLTVTRTRYGGHCGFALGVMRPSAADRFVLEQFERFERLEFGPSAR
jgi:predicted alpha/beta-fold hydrolase